MRPTENNEMDLLLRSLVRRETARSPFRGRTADEHASAVHLDADELSAYAERALPAATRARYTIHLSDCSRCRKIVAELTSVAGLDVREHLGEQETSTGFWQAIRHLFSLPALRYAVPALALLAVVAVGLVALRQQRPSGLVARNEPAAGPVALTENKQPETPAASNSAAAVSEKRPEGFYTTTGRDHDQKAKTGEQNEAKTFSSGESEPVVPRKDAPAEKAAGAVAQPSFAPEPGTPPPTKPQGAVADARTEPAPRKEPSVDSVSVGRAQERPQREERAARDKAEDRENQVAASSPRNAPPASDSLAKLRAAETRRGGVAGGRKADDEVAETRVVGGRRFRRQGGVWIDTAYQSSLSLTTVARGSEQYRALVADEPAIRTIADQLPGEVVLVWKGRAYRIR